MNDTRPKSVFDFMIAPEFWLFLLAVATRLVPHPPNFAPIGALALFAGASLRRPLLLALLTLFASDLVLGMHSTLVFVYAAFALIVGLGWLLRKQSGALSFTGAAVAGSLIFFFITNWGVWLVTDLYPKTSAGLSACFVAALPFFRNTLTADLLYTGALFGSLKLVNRWVRRSAELRQARNSI